MKDTAVHIEALGVKYNRRVGFFKKEPFWALKHVDLTIRHGETIGIVGSNGAGKSTLLKTIAGILQPDTGAVRKNCLTSSLLSLQVGFNPNLSGRDNAILSGMLMGLGYRHIRSRLREIVDFSELADFIDQPLKTYSTGMRARLGFAVAMQVDPDLLLVDEVLGVGDEEFRKKSTAFMRQRIRSDKTVILVSHNQNILAELCDRLAYIERGHSIAEGKPEDILAIYKQRQQRRPTPPALR